MSEDASPRNTNNPLIVIGDKIEAKTHLVALLQLLRTENGILPEEDQIQYAVCKDSTQVALALRRYLNTVKMILLGPELIGNSITVARMLSKKAKIVVVIDPQKKPLSEARNSGRGREQVCARSRVQVFHPAPGLEG